MTDPPPITQSDGCRRRSEAKRCSRHRVPRDARRSSAPAPRQARDQSDLAALSRSLFPSARRRNLAAASRRCGKNGVRCATVGGPGGVSVTRIRIQRERGARYPSKGAWPQFRRRIGTVGATNAVTERRRLTQLQVQPTAESDIARTGPVSVSGPDRSHGSRASSASAWPLRATLVDGDRPRRRDGPARQAGRFQGPAAADHDTGNGVRAAFRRHRRRSGKYKPHRRDDLRGVLRVEVRRQRRSRRATAPGRWTHHDGAQY